MGSRENDDEGQVNQTRERRRRARQAEREVSSSSKWRERPELREHLENAFIFDKLVAL